MNASLSFHDISKSTYVRGIKCRKSFYLYKFHPELRDAISASTQEKFDTGNEVGEYAQRLFPGGVNCGMQITQNGQKSVELTGKAISESKKVIYEAAFQFNKVLVIADIIVKSGDSWQIYEVKSSTEVKDYHYDDTAVQYYVISNCGYNIKDISIIHLNNQYVRKGEIETDKLFTIVSVKEQAVEKQTEVDVNLKNFIKIIEEKKEPEIDIGPHCSAEYDCDFIGHCWKHIPEYSVFDLSRMGNKAFDLYRQGIVQIRDIPESYGLSSNQLLEKICHLEGKDFIDKNEIKSFLSSIKYPVYFMDFESFQPAIPFYDNSKPYQQIVFQYSLHYKKNKKASVEHFEYLADGKSDPRLEFIKRLLEHTKKPGIILVYNQTFEKTRLNELTKNFPEYEMEIIERISRIVDLMSPFQKRAYYKPEMRSSHSLKKVLPALNPQYNYNNLEIHEGGMAGPEFLKAMNISDKNEIAKIRKNLLDYCGQDTYGLVVILEELEKIT